MTDFFLTAVLAETPMAQCSPRYSAASSSLMNPLPHCSNYSPFCPHPLYYLTLWINAPLVSSGQTLYQAAPLDTNTSVHCCSALQNLVGNSGETQCLEEAEQQAEASVDVPYSPLYLYPLSAPFLTPLSFPSTPSLLSLLINSLPS